MHYRPTLLLTAWLLVAVVTPLGGQQAMSDETRLRARIAAHQQASERGDLRGLVDLYADDAQTVSSTGQVIRGRSAIETGYRAQLATPAARSGRHHIHPPESVRIQLVTADVALVEVESVNVGGADTTGTPLPDSRVQLITVWRKRAERWVVVYQRSVPPRPPSAPAARNER